MSINPASTHFWRCHLFFPALLFCTAVITLETSRFDLIFADSIFQLEGQQWLLKDHFITSTLLHTSAQTLSKLLLLLLLIVAFISPHNRHLNRYRRGFWFLFVSMAVSAALVSIGKYFSHLHCPWDLLRYGGKWPYVALFDSPPANIEPGHCFPAGHASAGYGFVSLYFFFHYYQPRKKWLGLAIGLGMGLIYGFAQQLRGAHFLSHDLWTLSICWFSGLLFYWLMFQRQYSSDSTSTNEIT